MLRLARRCLASHQLRTIVKFNSLALLNCNKMKTKKPTWSRKVVSLGLTTGQWSNSKWIQAIARPRSTAIINRSKKADKEASLMPKELIIMSLSKISCLPMTSRTALRRTIWIRLMTSLWRCKISHRIIAAASSTRFEMNWANKRWRRPPVTGVWHSRQRRMKNHHQRAPRLNGPRSCPQLKIPRGRSRLLHWCTATGKTSHTRTRNRRRISCVLINSAWPNGANSRSTHCQPRTQLKLSKTRCNSRLK